MNLRFFSVNAHRALVWKLFASAVVLLAVGSGCHTTPAKDAPLPSQIVRIGGKHNARARMEGSTNWWAVKAGQLLKSGAVLQTDKDSYVDLWLGETARQIPESGFGKPYYPEERPINFVRLKQDSALRIDKVTRSTVTNQIVEVVQLSLQRGRVLGEVKKSAVEPNYEIRFPQGAMRMSRESIYEISVEGIIRVLSGTASVTMTETNLNREVAARQQFDLRTDQFTPIPPNPHEWPGLRAFYPVSETRVSERPAIAPRRKF